MRVTLEWIVALIILSRRTVKKRTTAVDVGDKITGKSYAVKNGNGRENVSGVHVERCGASATSDQVDRGKEKREIGREYERGVRLAEEWRGTEGDREK